MTLKQSNLYLKQASARKAALRVSAQSSSAIEGIRAPFAKGRRAPADAAAFIALWKRRVAVLLVGVRERNHQHRGEVGEGPQAAGEQRQHHEDDAHDGDVDIEIGGDASAHTAQHGTVADLIQAPGS